tara:strand:- start:143 stop:613 length:471 start_codon:yes stop_codon:yes gene_type:complete
MFAFNSFEDFIWLKYIFVALVSLIPVGIGIFFLSLFNAKKEGKLKEEAGSLILSHDNEKPKKIDLIVFFISLLFFIPGFIFIKTYPFLLGVPLMITGIYGLIFGRLLLIPYSPARALPTYYTGKRARYRGLLSLILGIVASWILQSYASVFSRLFS